MLATGPSDEWGPAAERLGLLVRVGTTACPTVTGMLCFGIEPQFLYPQWSLGAVRIHGRTLADRLGTSETFEGSLPVLLKSATSFIRTHTRSLDDAVAGGVASEYPEEAVREALVNAFVHRDLRHPGRVAIQIFDDRLIIRSPGGVMNGVPPLDQLSIEGGESIPRNPLLAATARHLGLCEQVGRGLTVIRRAMSAATREPTRIVATASEVRLILPSRFSSSEFS
ncbi:MAG: ATP-dependent DNA helicase RecG [Myxococcota bacterium]|jgi:ATP-dependent DNA helicase RecG